MVQVTPNYGIWIREGSNINKLFLKTTVIWGNLDQFSTLTLHNSIENCFLLLWKIAITSSISIVYAPDFWKLFENSKMPKNLKNSLNSSNPMLQLASLGLAWWVYETRLNAENLYLGIWLHKLRISITKSIIMISKLWLILQQGESQITAKSKTVLKIL